MIAAAYLPQPQLQLVRTLATIAGREPRLVFVPRSTIHAAGGSLSGSRQYFGENYELFSITVRVDKVQRDLGFQPTPLQAGLTETYQWYLRQASSDPPDFAFEDQLISASA